MTQEQISRANAMYAKNYTKTEIARELGVSITAICMVTPQSKKIRNYKYKNLWYWIRRNGYTLDTFADKLGITKKYLAEAMHGRNNPTKKLIDKMLNLTGMTYEQMFKEGVK